MSEGEHDDERNAGSYRSIESSGLEHAIQKTMCVAGPLASMTKKNIVALGVGGWLSKLAFLMCSWVILVLIQRSREQPIWSEMQSLQGNLQDITRSKHLNTKLTKGLQAEEVVMQKVWKELQQQVTTVQEVQKEFDNLRQKNVDFQDHLTTVLKDLSSGISDLKQRALPVNGEPEAKFEKTHFPVLWNAILNLEGRVKEVKTGSDPLFTRNLQNEVERLKEELYSANERLDAVRRQAKRERIQAMKDSMSAMKEELTEAGINHGAGHVLPSEGGRISVNQPRVQSQMSFIDEDPTLDEGSDSSMTQRSNRPNEVLSFEKRQPDRASFAGQYGQASASSLAEQKSISVRVAEDTATGAKAALQKIDLAIKEKSDSTNKLSADSLDKKAKPAFLNK